jgi:8-oxo-dGTP pyrophosphatase MutT (NUDIX family)
VAVVLRDRPGGVELLFIVRQRRRGDRWSGHVAFPGGLAEPGDANDAATARRETAEEVGLALAEPLGRLDDVMAAEPGSFRPMPIAPIFFRAPEPAELRLDPREVGEAFWVPLERLRGRRGRMWHRLGPIPLPFGMIELSGHRLWGLTLGMVDALLKRI